MRDEPGEAVDDLAKAVIGAAIEVHRQMGAGLTEKLYQRAMQIELRLRGLGFQPQVPVPVQYKGEPIGLGRIDLVVGNCLIVELKAVETLAPVHMAQAITYLRLTGHRLALLINFNVSVLKDGIKRIVLTES